MNQHEQRAFLLLQDVSPQDPESISNALTAFGHAIAVLSTMSGNREKQAEFLHKVFEAIAVDAGETMRHFDNYKAAKAQVSDLFKHTFNMPGARSNG